MRPLFLLTMVVCAMNCYWISVRRTCNDSNNEQDGGYNPVNDDISFANFQNILKNRENELVIEDVVEIPKTNSEKLQFRFLEMIKFEKLITIPGANNLHKYNLEKCRIVDLVSELLGTDIVALGKYKTSIIIHVVEIFQLVQKNMMDLAYNDFKSAEILFDWFLKFIAEGWPLFSKIIDNEIFDYIEILSESFNSISADFGTRVITKDLVKGSLENIMGESIEEYVSWYWEQSISQDEFIERQFTLLKKITLNEAGIDVYLRSYKLLEDIENKINSNSHCLNILWQKVYEKHLFNGDNDANLDLMLSECKI